MTPQEFLDEFGTLAESAEGVPKLRQLILELAVRGKLVEQNEDDEPASDLYQRMLNEASGSNGSGKRQPKASPDVTDEDAPFPIPSSWCWLRFGQFLDIQGGGQPPKSKFVYAPEDGYIRLLQIRDFGPKPEPVFVPRDTVTRLCTSDDVMLARYGASVGKVFLGQDGAYNVALTRILFSHEHLAQRFIHLLLRSPIFQVHLEDSSRSAQAGFNKGNIHPIPLPVAPLAEQHRIVSKVDELMGLCDRLEAVQGERRGVRARLNRSSLDRLTSVSGVGARQRGSELSAAWQRVCDHFEVLYDTPETLPDLRQTILQLAVQGKLVPQDPNDEPAEELLTHIELARIDYEQNGSARKRKPVPELTTDDIAFDAPSAWSWIQFEKIAELAGGVAKGRKLGGKKTVTFPYLRVANVQMGFLNLDVMKDIDIPLDELTKYRLERDDLLLTEGGDWDKLGRTAIWEGQIETCLHQNHVFRGRLYVPERIRPRWVRLVMNSGVGRDYFARASKQTTNLASINMTQLRSCPIPIPPAVEQERILAKVRSVLDHIDQLDETLNRRETTRTKALIAASHSILNGGAS